MAQKRNIILCGTESFSRGELDNVALENGAIVLDEVAGQHVLYGCYTSPELAMPPFSSLNVSWNADTPHGTVVEAQCRILAAGAWSGWKSLGKWSPEYPRAGAHSQPEPGDPQQIFVEADTITVGAQGGGQGVQLRIYLYTDDELATPAVRLLSAAVRPLLWEKQDGRPLNRRLYLPEYDMGSHDRRFGADMDLPLVLTALMNRFGADLLPEEIAYGMADCRAGTCRNAAYAAAIAGCCGHICYQAWMDLSDLREEIRRGYSVAVELTVGKTGGAVWMGLHGVGHDDSVMADYVQLNDPTAGRGAVARTMALADFRRCFTGRALVLHPRPRGVHGSRPLRRCGSLRPTGEPGCYQFEYCGAPAPLSEPFGGWLACAQRGGQACATTAARTFLPLEQAGGAVCLPETLRTPGARYTVFAVDKTGAMLVAELQLPGTPPKPAKPDTAAAAGCGVSQTPATLERSD